MLTEIALPFAAASSPEDAGGIGTVLALIIFIGASGWIGLLANQAMRSSSFMKGFFLGNRGIGAWAMALTATVQSGGTFMGFPSLVYTHGWSVAVWIGSYMIVPITGFGIIGKRLAQLSRRTGAITIPDLFRERFGSSTLGLVASLSILIYMTAMMVAQFKAGAIVMKLSWPGSGTLALSEDFSSYRLSASSLQSLNGLNGAKKLEALVDKNYPDEAQFTQALTETLSADELKDLKEPVLKLVKPIDWKYQAGLIIFTLTVVGYTMAGGFLAAVWTDLFQSVMMWFGVMVLLVLSLSYAGGLQHASEVALQNTGPGFVFGPGFDPKGGTHEFLPLTMALSMWVLWIFSGVSSPAGMVRVMAADSAGTLRRSIYLLSLYNCCIYLPLIVICVCGRALIPSLKVTDEIIPRMALLTTRELPGGSFIAGLILAAPFGAIMSTVSSYLVVISSGLVRDIYQRFLNPQATEHELRRMSYFAMMGVGLVAVLLNINPVAYLQALVVFSSTGAGCTFLFPALMACYWRRATVPGVLTAMLTGTSVVLTLYILGFCGVGKEVLIDQLTTFRPYYLFNFHPMLWGLLSSGLVGGIVSLCTQPPDAALLSRMFDVLPTTKDEGGSGSEKG